ncbi:TetR family transcriptional regulator C-terminal domain-containing protein [Microbacterium deminutum]|uniref:TetR family transcriptional regulator C-terminal domain-containing protein n=1 Tax=Microbacterium deminutum TaxID=344164 RepID=UPI003CD088D4
MRSAWRRSSSPAWTCSSCGGSRGPAEHAQLRAYVGIYGTVLARGRMCLCGMLASDFETLPAAVQQRVSEFFGRSYVWLEGVIDQGVADGRIPAPVSPRATAEALVAGLERAMLVSRPSHGSERFEAIADALLESMGVNSRG